MVRVALIPSVALSVLTWVQIHWDAVKIEALSKVYFLSRALLAQYISRLQALHFVPLYT